MSMMLNMKITARNKFGFAWDANLTGRSVFWLTFNDLVTDLSVYQTVQHIEKLVISYGQFHVRIYERKLVLTLSFVSYNHKKQSFNLE